MNTFTYASECGLSTTGVIVSFGTSSHDDSYLLVQHYGLLTGQPLGTDVAVGVDIYDAGGTACYRDNDRVFGDLLDSVDAVTAAA